MRDPMGLLLAAARVDPTLMEAARRVDAAITAARLHHRVKSAILSYDCYYGQCEGHGDDGGDECPLVDIECCAACLALARAINDEIVPDECEADECPVLCALEAMARP